MKGVVLNFEYNYYGEPVFIYGPYFIPDDFKGVKEVLRKEFGEDYQEVIERIFSSPEGEKWIEHRSYMFTVTWRHLP